MELSEQDQILLSDVIDMLSPLSTERRDLLIAKLWQVRPHWFTRTSAYWRKKLLFGTAKPRR